MHEKRKWLASHKGPVCYIFVQVCSKSAAIFGSDLRSFTKRSRLLERTVRLCNARFLCPRRTAAFRIAWGSILGQRTTSTIFSTACYPAPAPFCGRNGQFKKFHVTLRFYTRQAFPPFSVMCLCISYVLHAFISDSDTKSCWNNSRMVSDLRISTRSLPMKNTVKFLDGFKCWGWNFKNPQFFRCTFSAISRPMFAGKYSFCSIGFSRDRRVLQIVAPLKAKSTRKIVDFLFLQNLHEYEFSQIIYYPRFLRRMRCFSRRFYENVLEIHENS